MRLLDPPGPDLPLLAYKDEIIVPTWHLPIRKLQRDLYRTMVRCYAIELFPTEIMGCDQWEMEVVSTPGLLTFDQDVAYGARFGFDGQPPKYDPLVRMSVTAKSSKRRGYTPVIVPLLDIADGWWNRVDKQVVLDTEDVTEEELTLYKESALRVFIRWHSLAFHTAITKYGPEIRQLPSKIWVPDMKKAFQAPHPGAIVRLSDGLPGWVIREISPNIVVVEAELEDYDLETVTVDVADLELLG